MQVLIQVLIYVSVMKKITFKNSRSLNLVGNIYPADSDKIIILAHGFTSDKSANGRFDRLAEELNKAGFNALAFDFSGCGESDDDTVTVGKEVDDLKSAIAFAEKKGFRKIALLGVSLGGLVSLKSADGRISTIILWAPVTNAKDTSKRYTPNQLKEHKQTGKITLIQREGIRKKIVLDGKLLEERQSINQKELCSGIKCPVLILHGNKDTRVPLEDSISSMDFLPKDSRMEIIKGAGHGFFDEDLDRFIDLSVRWLEKKLI